MDKIGGFKFPTISSIFVSFYSMVFSLLNRALVSLCCNKIYLKMKRMEEKDFCEKIIERWQDNIKNLYYIAGQEDHVSHCFLSNFKNKFIKMKNEVRKDFLKKQNYHYAKKIKQKLSLNGKRDFMALVLEKGLKIKTAELNTYIDNWIDACYLQNLKDNETNLLFNDAIDLCLYKSENENGEKENPVKSFPSQNKDSNYDINKNNVMLELMYRYIVAGNAFSTFATSISTRKTLSYEK